MPVTTTYLARGRLSGRRPGTLRTWGVVLRAWEHHLQPRGILDATRFDVEEWIGRPGLAPATRRTYRTTLRGFYTWAVDEGLLGQDPTARTPAVRVAVGVPRPLSPDEVTLVLSTAGPRMRAWLLLMTLAGLRCMEVAALEPRDLVNGDAGWLIHLRETKGGRPDVVPAHVAVVSALAALPVRNGMWWDLGAEQVSRSVNAHLRGCGVNSTAHALRHTAATSWYRASGHDLLATQQLMRHASVSSTQVYARLDPTRGASVVNLVPSPKAS